MTRMLSVLVAAALVMLVMAGTAAAAMPPVPYFSQCDPRWSSDRLGGDGPTICSKGCALTSAAMVAAYYGVDTDPERLNDAIGVFRPSTAQFFLDYDNDGISDMNATLGVIGDIPVAGDWDGDGDDNIGVFRQNHSDSGLTMFFLDSDNNGYADLSVAFGEPDDLPVIGDWDGDGGDNIGLYRPGSTTGVFYLDIDNDGGIVDIVTPEYGDLEDIPIAGDWDGDSDDNIGVYRPGTGEFFMDASLPEVLPSKTIYVDDGFSDNPSEHKWDTIQEGVDDATDGDTVIVYAGEYNENVDVDKRITLEGEGADVVTVRAKYMSYHVFDVTADYVSISGFTVAGAIGGEEDAGINLDSVDNCDISDNNASNNACGIYLQFSDNNTLQNNTLANNIMSGIHLQFSDNNTLQNNTLANNIIFGIAMGDSSNNTLQNNTFTKNGLLVYNSYGSIVENNAVNGKPLVYLENIFNSTIRNAGQVILVNCTNITVENLNFSNTSVGVELWGTNDCKIMNNTISNNVWGILLCYSIDNTLQNNIALDNWRGIYLLYSNRYNTLQSNTASDNDCGIYIQSSDNNTLYHNNLNNTQNAYDTGTNTWDSGSVGNYYSDYTGTDPDGDGIGDTPYPIPGGTSIDRFPLMQPWTDTPQQKGDLNGDNQITSADAAIALGLAVGGSASCDAATLAAADVSGDGSVTSLDALMILQAADGAIEL